MKPMAPAFCALAAFVSNVQVPRRMSAKAPFSEFAGRAEQAVPSLPSAVMSTSGATFEPTWEGKKNESPSAAEIFLRFEGALDAFMLTVGSITFEMVAAPTEITSGA